MSTGGSGRWMGGGSLMRPHTPDNDDRSNHSYRSQKSMNADKVSEVSQGDHPHLETFT